MWVSTMIIEPIKRKERAKRWARLIKVAFHLRKLNNFFCLLAFISGMSLHAVSRLKFTLNSKELRNSLKVRFFFYFNYLTYKVQLYFIIIYLNNV